MRTRRSKIWFAVVVLLALVAAYLGTRGPGAVTANPPGTFSFGVFGDAPYSVWEDFQYRRVLQELDAHDLAWVLHVGDIFWQPCTEGRYRRSLTWFNSLRHPVIYTPGDNEWTDCWEPGSGGYAPRDRLDLIRRIFFFDPTRSLGGRALPVVSQAGREPFPELVENVRWQHEGIVFATVHLVGSKNGLESFPGRRLADDEAAKRRTAAAATWTRATFAVARAVDARAVVLGFHANPAFKQPVLDPYRQAYEPFLTVLEDEVEAFSRPVLVAHGDDHVYTVDHPLVRRTTRRRLTNLTRLQVPGSPAVGWVRVTVTAAADAVNAANAANAATAPFAFELRVVPRWKYW